MNHRAFLSALAVTWATAASAEPLDPCALLSGADLLELEVPAGTAPVHKDQPGGVHACEYKPQSASGATQTVTVMVSDAARDRVLQFRAMLAKALSENTQAQLEARGEYYAAPVMCKVAASAQLETSQCLGATEQSVVALALSHSKLGDKPAYPTVPLRLISALVARVGAAGG